MFYEIYGNCTFAAVLSRIRHVRVKGNDYRSIDIGIATAHMTSEGGLAVVIISKNAKLSVLPVLLMLALFIFVPALDASAVGILVSVGIAVTVLYARILYKKGKL